MRMFLQTSLKSRDLAIVAAFTFLVMAPFWCKAYHIDEPFFMSLARDIPHPLWGPGAIEKTEKIGNIPWPSINNNPPLLLYFLAPAMHWIDGSEWVMRMTFFPIDLIAALSLYLLAARFLKYPLLPTLIVIASPAYMINMNHLMTEKLAAAFGFACLYCLVRGVEDNSRGWRSASAGLLGAALMSKYLSAFLLPTAAYYFWRKGAGLRRVSLYFGLALFVPVWFFLRDVLGNGDILRGIRSVNAGAAAGFWAHGSHRSRSFFAFAGGCSVISLVWPYWASRRGVWIFAFWVAMALFFPSFDLVPDVRLLDRLTGILFAYGAICAFAVALGTDARGTRGWPLWTPWLVSAGVVGYSYWTLMARTIVFLVPPLVFSIAAVLETKWKESALQRLYAASLAGTVLLSLTLASVDFKYANAQKSMAMEISKKYVSNGKRIWCAAHLGLHHYLLVSGALEMDWVQGGWDSVKPGDVVVTSKTNAVIPSPKRPLLADVHSVLIESSLPLRLISGWGGEAGFYSNISGFLPFSISLEPLEQFHIIEVRQ